MKLYCRLGGGVNYGDLEKSVTPALHGAESASPPGRRTKASNGGSQSGFSRGVITKKVLGSSREHPTYAPSTREIFFWPHS